MSESRFFEPPTGLTIGEIVALTGAQPRAGTDLSRRLTNIAPLDMAGSGDLTYVESSKYLGALKSTRAGACLMAKRFESAAPDGLTVLYSREPHRDFTAVARTMYANALRPVSLFDGAGVAAGAFIHPSAKVDNGAVVDPGAVIGPRAEIGTGTVIGAGAVIGPKVRIGRDCSIGAGSTITHATLGDRIIVHPGCRIGQDGFGYVPTAKGHVKVPQIGGVVIQDDVEIGAGTTIDRGAMRDTVIGEGTKIDNLVQIAHNVQIGRHCIIVAQTGIAGSVTIEDFVVLGARVGIIPHMTVGKGAQIAARSSIAKPVPPGARWGGTPAKPIRQWIREMATVEKLAARSDLIESPPLSDASQADDAPAATPTRQR
jgi:UDP-3-O-[3-hydroxymyristoyl] glucosamine N-acyltransferase